MVKPTSLLPIILLSSFLLGGCIARDTADTRYRILFFPADWRYDKAAKAYAKRDALAEARASFAQGRYAIYSAMGRGRYFPGLDHNLGYAIAEKYSSIPIPGTSDVIDAGAHGDCMEAAKKFASAYNQEIARLLKKIGKLPKPKTF